MDCLRVLCTLNSKGWTNRKALDIPNFLNWTWTNVEKTISGFRFQ